MHELSLAGGILKLVEDAAARESFARVLQLRLEVGKLAAVEVQALRFALESLVIDEPAGQAWCMGCSQTVEIAARGDPCPSCGGHWLTPQSGEALRVVDMQVV